jgi:hypothetical protein
VDAINKLNTDSGHGGSKNQTITMIGPLWEIAASSAKADTISFQLGNIHTPKVELEISSNKRCL